MSDFFINRPIFAWVLAILVMLAGALSFWVLPVAQFPEIASPQVVVTASCPGASAKTMEDTVTQVIEQQISGIDGLMYMSSESDSTGTATLTFTFENGTDIDIAQVQIQNKLQLATPRLPEEVQRQGLNVSKSSAGILLIMGLTSRTGMTDEDLGDYLASHLQEPLSRIPGVGQLTTLSSQYAMRVWCDPLQMAQYRLNPSDVVRAIREQNSQTAGGQVGACPVVAGQEINLIVNASSRLTTVEEFEQIILKKDTDGSVLRLHQVARMALQGERFNNIVKINGNPGAAVVFGLAPGANAMETAAALKRKIEELSAFFPPGMEYTFTYDSTPFVELSIHQVYRTLVEAIVLVCLVMFLFLQDIRATLIPTLAIPVVLLGTFAVLAAAGYSINTLTMFGIVLAIGLLVDDAIVVVENVERLMKEDGLSPKEAAEKSMRQISGALVGVALVIASIFVPMAFMPGSVGIIYRQFSITIVTAMALSALVALILSPALCATMLKPHRTRSRFFKAFNNGFERFAVRYKFHVRKMLHAPKPVFFAFVLGLGATAFLFMRLPTSFVPEEDQGAFYASVQLPPGASMERTEAVLADIRSYILTEEADVVRNILTVAGYSFIGAGQNVGQVYIVLRDWDRRTSPEMQIDAVLDRVRQRFRDMPQARIAFFRPATIREMARSSGFEFELMDLTGQGHDALMETRDILLEKARAHPLLYNARSGGLDDVTQYDLRVDIDKAVAHGLNKGEINAAIATYWGGSYVNDFTDRGRTKKVYVQADAPFRMQASDFNRYFIRNDQGGMVPFPVFLSVSDGKGSPRLERYQGVPAVKLLGEAAPGYSSGVAMRAMEELAASLPEGFGFEWTGMSYQERQAGSQAGILYAISLAAVFLCLAALYESWSIPLAVLLVVPSGIFGAVAGVHLAGLSNGVYFHIGLLAVMGLSAKNSILIIAFARDLHARGQDLASAVRIAVHLRLRPIIMTSLAFILGVLPLALNSGAGSGAQNAVGTTVVWGVLSATFFSLYLTPLFFVGISRLFAKKL
ncbi:efflux RND transporter permease subunit [Desulfovibrio sp. ZJ200]|uniref:efflux RND transporter permease subunit n=1 Tax=Desulfovibrio sp. ZJ200 TaxID=2709792 RepID=UPI0013EB0E80|nr:efflux RND transporter permease subunit [Desulfovibrio sp. ZJ200]